VDSKDFQILVAIHQDARQSLLSLGRRVSLSAPAVRERLRRLRRTGVLLGYGLWMDPIVFDRQEVLIFFKRERTRDQVTNALKAPDVAYIGWKIDGGLTVGAWTDDVTRSIRELNISLGEKSAGHAITGAGDVAALSVLDHMIADALIDDPKIPFEELVESTKLSPKTVRKHLESMIRSETLVIIPRLGASTGSGELVYNLAVAGKAPMSEIRKILEDALMVHETRNPPMKYLLCRSTDLGDINSKTRAMSRLEGIQSVAITLNRELLFANDFIHSLVRGRIRELETKRTSQVALISS
jgi:DNA-binding Lrp family transcriptional regulator